MKWFDREGRDLPWRKTRDPYAVLVSEFMLQQTRVETVRPYFERWMRRLPDFHALARAEEAEILKLWEGLGYYSRARNLHRLAKVVVEEHGGRLPDQVDILRQLPGVGPYTASAVAAFAFELPELAMDGNIIRVLSRWFEYREPVDRTAGLKELHRLGKHLLPKKEAWRFNSALMELGATICVAGQPRCVMCPVQSSCQTVDPASLPVKRARPVIEEKIDSRALIRRNEKLFLEQSDVPPWAGLYKFPIASATDQRSEPLLELSYSITRYKVTLRLFEGDPAGRNGRGGSWVSWKDVEKIAMPAPYRRALRKVM